MGTWPAGAGEHMMERKQQSLMQTMRAKTRALFTLRPNKHHQSLRTVEGLSQRPQKWSLGTVLVSQKGLLAGGHF